MSAHIAIAGGGLVGASLALALLRGGARERGWKISLIEPFAPGDAFQPSYDARSSALAWGTRLIYQRLGIWDEIRQHAEPIRRIHVSEQGSLAAMRMTAEEMRVPALGYVADNAWLGQCLWRALKAEKGIHWRCPARVSKASLTERGYHLALDEGRGINCDLLVLADGGRSDLREQLGIGVRRTPYGQTAIIANVSTASPHGGEAFERFTPDGPMALLPLDGNRSALVLSRADAEAERLLTLEDAAFLRELQAIFGYRLGAFTRIGQRHSYPLNLLEADEQVRRHLVVLGNAAHGLHPIAGQGYNLSLRDVMALSAALLQSEAIPGDLAVLKGYLASQRLDQSLTVGFSDQVTRLFSNRNPWLSSGRRAGLIAMDLLPPLRQWFTRQAMGLGTRP